jgi:hypothetical protein
MNLEGKSGKVKCLVLPIAENKLFEGQKGLYLDLVGFEIKEVKGDNKQTHLLKQSFSKDVLDNMTEDQKNEVPILGALTDWTKVAPETKSETIDQNSQIEDDLPF